MRVRGLGTAPLLNDGGDRKPAGVRCGSSVIGATIIKGTGFGDAISMSYSLREEAVAVDLPGGNTLFALLRSESDPDIAGCHARRVQGAACGKGAPFIRPDPALRAPGPWAGVGRGGSLTS